MRLFPFLVCLLATAVSARASTPTWTADNGNGTFTNPLFYDEFSDPDLIRVGEDYYMTGTTMHANPGLPILHSRDLVNWTLLGYASDRLDLGPEYRLEEGGSIYGNGIWAPTFRHHEGVFHIFTNINQQKTQHFFATNPAGPWTREPMRVSLHDLSVLFDDDGHAYVIWGYRGIQLARLTPDLKDIVPGTQRLILPADSGMGEGVHFYKIRGRYYIISANYDPVGYMVCARADRIEGPYEVTTISAEETLGTGDGWRLRDAGRGTFGAFDVVPPAPAQMGAIPLHQGGVVDTPSGEWWGFSMMDHNSVGRLTALSPVTWQDDWPYFGLPGNLLRTPRTWLKPDTGTQSAPTAPYQRSDDFAGPMLANVWQWNHAPTAGAWSLGARPGHLRLQALPAEDFWLARNTLTQRAVGPASTATTLLDPAQLAPGDIAGLALLNYPYTLLGVSRQQDDSLVLQRIDQDTGEAFMTPLPAGRVWLRATCDFDRETAQLSYSTDGETFQPAGEPFTLIFQLRTFQGVRYALFNYNRAGVAGGYADFDTFTLDEPRAQRSIPLGRTIRLTSRLNDHPLSVWRGRLRLMPPESAEAASAASLFRVVDRGQGRVALQAADGSGYVTITGLGGIGDAKLQPELDPVRSVFQWQHMLQGDTMLLSLATHRMLTASPAVGGLASADSPGAAPDRRGGATFWYEVMSDAAASD